MTPIEETYLYQKLKDNVQVSMNLDDPNRRAYLRVDAIFMQNYEFPLDVLNEQDLMEQHTEMLIERMFYSILEQCGITQKDIQFLKFCEEFIGKDCYDYIPAYRGYRMGARDSRNEESSGVVGEE